MNPEERKIYAQSMFAQHNEYFPDKNRFSILQGVVTLGMSPFEARLAGGAFQYRVAADSTRWPEHSDPLKVMWAQSVQADNSEIIMIFTNALQYPGQGEKSFRVYFDKGTSVKIEQL